MRNSVYAILASALLAALLCGCAGGGPQALAPDQPQLRVSAALQSDWQAADLDVALAPAADGWQLSLASRAAQPAGVLLVELRFDEAWAATAVQRMVLQGELDLLVAERPGVLALGVIMPAGATIAPGPLLTARLVSAPPLARAVSKVPAGAAGRVTDLAGVEDGVGGFALSWGYVNVGDYDQNSEANISDLVPLALRLNALTTDGDRDALDSVLDGDHNTEVNSADITPLGLNFTNRMDGYRLFRADGPDPETATAVQVAEVAFAQSTLAPDSRRAFAYLLSGAALVTDAYYFVRPFDDDAGEEGAASNVVQYVPAVQLKFQRPPAGSQIVDGATAQNPSLVLMPAIPGVSEAGAPVIFYTTLGGGSVTPLMQAYYGESGWVTEEIGAGGNYSMPQALFIPGEGEGTGEGVVVVYSINNQRVVDRRFDEQWQLIGAADVGVGGTTLSQLALDRDALSGALGVAHAYTTATGGQVHYSYTDELGAWNTQPVYDGQFIGGLAFRFDPSGADPWLLFTHGTVNTTGVLALEFSLEQARRSGGLWEITPVPHPDSPLVVDLTFRADGTPQLTCNAASSITLTLPGLDPITASMSFDVLTGEFSSGGWTLTRAYESEFGFDFDPLPPPKLIIALNLAADVGWAKPDELLYSLFTGEVVIDIESQLPEDGALTTESQYMRWQEVGGYSDSGYYDGDPGRSYSWQVNSAGDPVCAFIRSTSMSVSDLLSGNFAAAGELAYWQP